MSKEDKSAMIKNYDIFVSYSHKDYEIAQKINDVMRDWGYNPYFDKLDIKAGDVYAEKIKIAIANSRLIIVIYSEHLGKSPWNRKEIEFAKSKGKKILVLNFDTSCQTDEWFNSSLSNYHCIDISEEEESAISSLSKSLQDIFVPHLNFKEKGDDSTCVEGKEESSKTMQEYIPKKTGKGCGCLLFLLLFIAIIIGFFFFTRC